MAKKPDFEWRVISAALRLSAEQGWRQLSMADIAAAAKSTPAKVSEVFPSKLAILKAFNRRIDEQVLSDGPLDGESVRDDLFELLMRRFEALKPHRDGLRAILRGTVAIDPIASICGMNALLKSMARMLEGEGVKTSGIEGRLRIKVLTGIYLSVGRVWLSDDSDDLSRTMATLDRALKRLEQAVQSNPFKKPRGQEPSKEAA
ncbi:MAG: helix-turn-helix domain containing protein [Proteobacteria bacterium]|nr:helix-turn-helix domain containing protein [Pseudomonadota bacterium]